MSVLGQYHTVLCFHSFVISFEIGMCESFNFVFLFKKVLAIHGPLPFHMNLMVGFPIFAKKAVGSSYDFNRLCNSSYRCCMLQEGNT